MDESRVIYHAAERRALLGTSRHCFFTPGDAQRCNP